LIYTLGIKHHEDYIGIHFCVSASDFRMSSQSDELTHQINEITECSICSEVFQDPRVLPCVHTFCFSCLKAYGKSIKPGGLLECPLCRRACPVPNGGFKDFPKNYMAQQLIEVNSGVHHLSAGITDVEPLDKLIAKKTTEIMYDKEQLELNWAQLSKDVAAVDDHANELLDQLKSTSGKVFDELQKARKEADDILLRLNELQVKSNSKSNGKSNAGACELRSIRAEVNTMRRCRQEQKGCLTTVKFQPTILSNESKHNLIGRIEEASLQKTPCK
jgi:RING-type zinc-finger